MSRASQSANRALESTRTYIMLGILVVEEQLNRAVLFLYCCIRKAALLYNAPVQATWTSVDPLVPFGLPEPERQLLHKILATPRILLQRRQDVEPATTPTGC